MKPSILLSGFLVAGLSEAWRNHDEISHNNLSIRDADIYDSLRIYPRTLRRSKSEGSLYSSPPPSPAYARTQDGTSVRAGGPSSQGGSSASGRIFGSLGRSRDESPDQRRTASGRLGGAQNPLTSQRGGQDRPARNRPQSIPDLLALPPGLSQTSGNRPPPPPPPPPSRRPPLPNMTGAQPARPRPDPNLNRSLPFPGPNLPAVRGVAREVPNLAQGGLIGLGDLTSHSENYGQSPLTQTTSAFPIQPATIIAGGSNFAAVATQMQAGVSDLRAFGTKSAGASVRTGYESEARIKGVAPGSKVDVTVGQNSHVTAKVENHTPGSKAQMQVTLRGGQASAEIYGASHRKRELGPDGSALWWASDFLID